MISTKGRYALRVMIDIAEHNSEDNIPLKDVAERQEISKKYLEAIIQSLVKNNLLTGTSGKGGGYRLCRKPEEYTVGEIIEATEGPFITVSCLADKNNKCPRASKCKTLPLWEEFDKITRDFFYSRKLTDLM